MGSLSKRTKKLPPSNRDGLSCGNFTERNHGGRLRRSCGRIATGNCHHVQNQNANRQYDPEIVEAGADAAKLVEFVADVPDILPSFWERCAQEIAHGGL